MYNGYCTFSLGMLSICMYVNTRYVYIVYVYKKGNICTPAYLCRAVLLQQRNALNHTDSGQALQVKLTTNIRIGKRCDLWYSFTHNSL